MYGVGLETVTGLEGHVVLVFEKQWRLEAAYSLSGLESDGVCPSVVVFDISTSVIFKLWNFVQSVERENDIERTD